MENARTERTLRSRRSALTVPGPPQEGADSKWRQRAWTKTYHKTRRSCSNTDPQGSRTSRGARSLPHLRRRAESRAPTRWTLARARRVPVLIELRERQRHAPYRANLKAQRLVSSSSSVPIRSIGLCNGFGREAHPSYRSKPVVLSKFGPIHRVPSLVARKTQYQNTNGKSRLSGSRHRERRRWRRSMMFHFRWRQSDQDFASAVTAGRSDLKR
jgi:hypothetical protein